MARVKKIDGYRIDTAMIRLVDDLIANNQPSGFTVTRGGVKSGASHFLAVNIGRHPSVRKGVESHKRSLRRSAVSAMMEAYSLNDGEPFVMRRSMSDILVGIRVAVLPLLTKGAIDYFNGGGGDDFKKKVMSDLASGELAAVVANHAGEWAEASRTKFNDDNNLNAGRESKSGIPWQNPKEARENAHTAQGRASLEVSPFVFRYGGKCEFGTAVRRSLYELPRSIQYANVPRAIDTAGLNCRAIGYLARILVYLDDVRARRWGAEISQYDVLGPGSTPVEPRSTESRYMDSAIDAAVAAGIARRFHGRRGLRIGGRGTIVGKLIEENAAAREKS